MRRFSPTRVRSRTGFTLVELLVVMALIATLAAIALVVAPSALEKDRAATAVSQLQGAMQISRAKAMRDGLPRGIRLISNGSAQLSEYQYIESPPVFVPNPGGSTGVPPYAPTAPPYIQFNYALTGTMVTNRECRVYRLVPDHVLQLQSNLGGYLFLPTLGTWHKFNLINGPFNDGTQPGNPQFYTLVWSGGADQFHYPDQQLGAETMWRTYHFGFYGVPRPLLGEPVLRLPEYSCVDIGLSQPAAGTDYDILFAPSGQLIWTTSTRGEGQVFLWVRDPSRPANLQQGGEQMIVAIKAKSGALGAAPVDWGADPYFLARKALSGQ